MANKDKMTEKQIAHGISATLSGATPATGNIVDMSGFNAVTFAVQTGAVTDAGAAAGFSIKLQHSATTADADFADCATADMVGGTASLSVTSDSDDNVAVGMLGYIGIKRYVRAVATGTTGTNAVVNAVAVKECGHYAPSDQAATNVAAT
jgi:hypothetical protein